MKKRGRPKPRRPRKNAKGTRPLGSGFRLEFGVTHVILKRNSDDPKHAHARCGDLVTFVNASGEAYATLDFVSSPFKVGNGAETFKVTTVVTRQVAAGTPIGSYDSEKSFPTPSTTGGPPDGPSIDIDG
jgi:hypothetical protein